MFFKYEIDIKIVATINIAVNIVNTVLFLNLKKLIAPISIAAIDMTFIYQFVFNWFILTCKSET